MKLFFVQILTIYIIVLSSSCRQIETGTLDYNTLNYDTDRVALFLWDTTKYLFPNNSDPLPLTQNDLFVTDSLLKNAIDSFNAMTSLKLFQSFGKVAPLDSFIIDAKRYKTQFFPYRDVNGERIVLVIGFNTNFPSWKTEVYIGRLHYGIHKFELKVNLSNKLHEDIQTGSYS